MKRNACFLALLAGLFLPGCAARTLYSNVRPGVIPAFSRVLVVANTKRDGDGYARQVAARFPPGYAVTPLGFDDLSFGNLDSLVAQKIAESGSEVVLLIGFRPTGGTVRTGRYSSGMGFEWYAEMRRASEDQPFWKAVTSVAGTVSRPLPEAYLQRLVSDGILQKSGPRSASAPTTPKTS